VLKYKTKPITLLDSVDEIWKVLEQQDETIQILMQEIRNLQKRVKELERNNSNPEADTKRLN